MTDQLPIPTAMTSGCARTGSSRGNPATTPAAIVRLTLTGPGEEKLSLLSTIHSDELARLSSLFSAVLDPAVTARGAP